MSVANILQSKGSGEVLTISGDKKVSEAAAMLSQRRIGSLVVSTDGKKADGILSERDIVREIGQRGSICLEDTVADMMTRNVITCEPTDRVDDILEQMTAGRFRHMPVVTDGELVGIVTLGDVVKFKLEEVKMEKTALEGMIMGH